MKSIGFDSEELNSHEYKYICNTQLCFDEHFSA